MGKLFREDGSPVKRDDPDYHKYYQRWRKSNVIPNSHGTNNKGTPFGKAEKANRTIYIRKPKKEVLLELRDAMISKRMAKHWIKLIEDMI